MKNLDMKLTNQMAPFIKAIQGGMGAQQSKRIARPPFEYGALGVFGFFEIKLKHIAEYADLKPVVMQNFRDFGNCLAFIKNLDAALAFSDTVAYVQAAPFMGTTEAVADTTVGSSALYRVVSAAVDVMVAQSGGKDRPAW